MEKPLVSIYQILQKLTGLHRQLWEVVRHEREALVQANLKDIQSLTATKQALIEEIHQAEATRVKMTGELALHWRKPFRELTLTNIIIQVQGIDPKFAEQLRSIYNALTVLIQRIAEQNSDNRAFVEKSLEHVYQMKKNILEESNPKSATYNHQGQRAANSPSSRLITQEA